MNRKKSQPRKGLQRIHLAVHLLILFGILATAEANSSTDSSRTIFLSVVPHSHDDSGWLETYNNYYKSKVRHILTSVVDQLASHSSKRFTWDNISFFQRWYDHLDEEGKSKFAHVLASGQFEFVGGSWVQSDEATVEFQSLLENYDTGLRFLRENFGVRPRVAW